LASPSVSIFSINLDVASEEKDFSANVDVVVNWASRLSSTVMVVQKGFIESDDTSIDSCDLSELAVVVLNSR